MSVSLEQQLDRLDSAREALVVARTETLFELPRTGCFFDSHTRFEDTRRTEAREKAK